MPRRTEPLTDKTIKNAKPSDKPRRLFDGGGLHLLINPDGSKCWRLKYLLHGKEKRIGLGVYPAVSLAEARAKVAKERRKLKEGNDPATERKAAKETKRNEAANTFEVIAREWHAKVAANQAESTSKKRLRFLEVDVFPFIGSRPIAELAAPDLLAVIHRIENRGAMDIARRVHNICGRIFRYAVGKGLATRDPSRDIELKDILPPEDVKHHASVTEPKAAGELLRAIDGFTGAFTTRCALRLAPLVFVRPGELRHAEWSEFDFDKSEWRIPAGKMKMKEQHIVPLASQAVSILREIQAVTGEGRYVFPGERTRKRPMSENTINGALRRLGYTKEEMTGHGFRSMASTLLHELGFPHAVIEAQLAHGERNKVSAAYNYAKYLPERKEMMRFWADYLGSLAAGGKVIAFKKSAA